MLSEHIKAFVNRKFQAFLAKYVLEECDFGSTFMFWSIGRPLLAIGVETPGRPTSMSNGSESYWDKNYSDPIFFKNMSARVLTRHYLPIT